MKYINLASIEGDGIGPEVMKEAYKVIDAVEKLHGGIKFEIDAFDWNCEHYQKTGQMMPDNGLDILKDYHSIVFGAVGSPDVPDHISVWQLILPIRKKFEQYVNLRPAKLLKGLTSPLHNKTYEDIDFVIIRENTEGEYSNSGGTLHEGTAHETAIQNSVFTRYGTERIIDYAFQLCEKQQQDKLAIATKSNAMNYSMPFWDKVALELAEKYTTISPEFYHVDALAALMVLKPENFNVIVASNLFGDILTDLGAAISGGLGLGPSGNINPEKEYPSMFEAIHGSAPDIAGKNIANPIAQIWSVSMMLDHLGYEELGAVILHAIEDVLVEGTVRTPDLQGTSTTTEMGNAIIKKMLRS